MHLVRCRQVAPVDAPVAGLEERRHGFLEHVAHLAGRGVGDAQAARACGRARSRRKRGAPRRDSTARRPTRRRGTRRRRRAWSGAGRAASGSGRPSAASTSMTTRWIMVTVSSPGSGYFQACSFGWPTRGVHQIHLADAALVLLKGRDLFRIGRPEQDRPVAVRPAGVVGGVAEILHAVAW